MPGLHYSIRPDKTYFITLTVVDWIDVFTRLDHKLLVIDSLKHCQKEKELNIFAWQKINYIYQNPVVEKIVYKEEDYLFSSDRNYYNLPSVLEIDCLTPQVLTAGMSGFYKTNFD